MGYDDIDFESNEFSKNFCVRSKNKKFAYDFCNSQMIEYLMPHSNSNLEVEGQTLALIFNSTLEATNIQYRLDILLEIRKHIPDFVWNYSYSQSS